MKSQIYFYFSNHSNIKDVFEIKKFFKKQKVEITYMFYRNDESIVDSLNVSYNKYFVENSIPLLTKPMNWVLCTYFDSETGHHVVIGKENIFNVFEQ
jgi:hypothetical protein